MDRRKFFGTSIAGAAGIVVGNQATASDELSNEAKVFANVEAMKAGNLSAGDIALTQGYHEPGDGGHGEYLISNTTTRTVNGYFHGLMNGNFAELLTGNAVNVKQFGAKGDGKANDTIAIQNALDLGGSVYIPSGVFLFEPGPNKGYISGNHIYGEGSSSVLKLFFEEAPTTITIQQILRPKDYENTENVQINDLLLDGSRDSIDWNGVSGDGNAFGLAIWGGQNIKVDNVEAINCWTDGFYIARTHYSMPNRRNAKNLVIGNISARNCGRQGLSIISGERISIDTLFVDGVERTDPKAALDIEPNNVEDKAMNISIGKIVAHKTGAGVILAGVSVIEQVTINSILCDNVMDTVGLQITSAKYVHLGSVTIKQQQGHYPALLVDDYDNIYIDSFMSELKPNAAGAADAVRVDDNKSANNNTNLRINNFFVNGARISGFRNTKGTNVSVGRGIVKNVNQAKAGGVGWFFEDEIKAEYIETQGVSHDYALRLGTNQAYILDAKLTPGEKGEVYTGGHKLNWKFKGWRS